MIMTTIGSINVNDLDKDFDGDIEALFFICLVYPPRFLSIGICEISPDRMARLDSKQHLKNLSGHGCPAIYEVGRARIFAEA